VDLIIERVSSCSVSHCDPNSCRVQLIHYLIAINISAVRSYELEMDAKRCQRIAERMELCLSTWSEFISKYGGGADQRRALDIAFMLTRELAHPDRASIMGTDLEQEATNQVGAFGLVGGSSSDTSGADNSTVAEFLMNESLPSMSGDEDVMPASPVPEIVTSSNGSPLSGARGGRHVSSLRAVLKHTEEVEPDPWVGYGRGNPWPWRRAELPLTAAVRKMFLWEPDLSRSAVLSESPYFADAEEESSPEEEPSGEGPDSV